MKIKASREEQHYRLDNKTCEENESEYIKPSIFISIMSKRSCSKNLTNEVASCEHAYQNGGLASQIEHFMPVVKTCSRIPIYIVTVLH